MRAPPGSSATRLRRVYERLREELGMEISERTVVRVVAALREEPKKAYLPLSFPLGEVAQADFGEAEAILGGSRRRDGSSACGWGRAGPPS